VSDVSRLVSPLKWNANEMRPILLDLHAGDFLHYSAPLRKFALLSNISAVAVQHFRNCLRFRLHFEPLGMTKTDSCSTAEVDCQRCRVGAATSQVFETPGLTSQLSGSPSPDADNSLRDFRARFSAGFLALRSSSFAGLALFAGPTTRRVRIFARV